MIESAKEFVTLRVSENPLEYRRAAWEQASESTWQQVIAEYPEMMEWVAHNKTIGEATIRLLFKVGCKKVKHVLARKRSTPPDLLEELATNDNESIRLAVACNPKASDACLSLLKNDTWEEVRRVVSRRLVD